VTYARSVHVVDRSDLVERARIVSRWQSATSWVTGQLQTVRRIERETGFSQREAKLRAALDRPDEPQETA
jgi:hypothetical protein